MSHSPCSTSPFSRAFIITIAMTLLFGISPDKVRAVNLAEIIVTTTMDTQADDGNCSLREALINANSDNQSGSTDCGAGNGADTITFSLSTPAIIALTGQLPVITSAITIQGPATTATELTISGDHSARVLQVNNAALTLNSLTIANGFVAGDINTGSGGGIRNDGGQVTLINSVVSGNTATFGGGITSSGFGGAITIISSTVASNYANWGGGLFNDGGSTATIEDSTFSGNVAASGGGIQNHLNATMNITNSTLSGNSVTGSGGGIVNLGVATIVNSTVSDSIAGVGGGLYTDGAATARYTKDFVTGMMVTTLINTIIANSSGGDCVANYASVIDGGNNIVEDNSCGFAGGSDPRLGPLQNNGGPTLTHALAFPSPAIDAANPNNCPTNDQRGVARPLDGNADDNPVCDIGAYELPTPFISYLPLITTPDPTAIVDEFPFADRCTQFPVRVNGQDKARVTMCVTSVQIRLDGQMKFNVRWAVEFLANDIDYVYKGSDVGNRNMNVTDSLNNRYDHNLVGGAAAQTTYFYRIGGPTTADGWYLFPPARSNGLVFTFHDDDQGVAIGNIVLVH